MYTNILTASSKYADAVESYKIASYQNILATTSNVTSAAIDSDIVIINADGDYRLEVNNTASAASVLLPSGKTTLLINRGDTLSFVRVSTPDVNLSVIVPSKE